MKIELALSVVDSRTWKGLVMIDGELFKVTIFPGSFTTDWEAEIAPTLFVEVTHGNKLEDAINLAYRKWKLGESVEEDEFRVMLKVIEEHPEMLEEIEKALEKR